MNDRVDLPQAREVCPATTRRLIGEGALLVDVRERAEVERLAFDVPDIVVMPLSEFERRFAELPRDRDLVMVCESGPRSLKATYFLMYHGFTRVANMGGGLLKWASKGFPIHGQAPGVPSESSGCCSAGAGAGAHAGHGVAASSCCDAQAAASQDAGCCGGTTPSARTCC